MRRTLPILILLSCIGACRRAPEATQTKAQATPQPTACVVENVSRAALLRADVASSPSPSPTQLTSK
jgi:hypothetical protein